MNRKEKWQYFKDYYLKKLLLIAAALALVISLLITIFGPKPKQVLSVAVSNYSYLSNEFSKMSSEMLERLGVEPKKNEVLIDSSYNMPDDYNGAQKLIVLVAAGDLDVFIGTEEALLSYAEQEFFLQVSDYLPTELFIQLDKDNLLFNSYLVERDYNGAEISRSEETYPYAIYLDTLSCFKDYSAEGLRPVLGVFTNTKNKENAVEFISYLFETYGVSEQ